MTAGMGGSAGTSGRVASRNGALLVWEYQVLVWRRFAVSSLAEAVGTPLLYLLALGLGVGSLVDSGPGAGSLGGVSYLDYLAPALLTGAALQIGVNEASYPVFSGFQWTKVFWGMTATPISPVQIALGQVLYIGSRLLISSTLYYVGLLLFGAGGGPAGALMVAVATLTGLSCALWCLVLSATIRKEGSAFALVFRFVVIPMTLFSGSFFPISAMPAVIRPLAWISPLWHGNELARAAALGRWQPLADLGHLLLLAGLCSAGIWMAGRAFTRRLIV